MPIPRLAAAISLIASSALAQVNPFVFYPQDPERQQLTCTSFVGRPDVSAAAEALMVLDTEHFRGIADANGFQRFFGIYHWLADEKLSTSESYSLVVRRALPSGAPDMSTAGERLVITGLSSPPSTSTARGTWYMYDGFSIQGGLWVLPSQGNVALAPDRTFFGVQLPANPLWPATDGHSLFRADLLSANTGAVFGENHRAGAPHPTWAGKQGVPSFTTPWTYVLGPFVTSPNLHLGGVDPTSNRLGAPGANLSMNGLFPDIGGQPRRDGLIVRVTDNIAPNAIVGVGGAVGFQPPYYLTGPSGPFFGPIIGHSFIGTEFTAIPLYTGLLTNGVREWTIALPNTINPALVGTDFAFQAVVWDGVSNVAEWTNAQEVHL
jgi:hypothetical protein